MGRIGEEKTNPKRVAWGISFAVVLLFGTVFYWALLQWMDADSLKAQIVLTAGFSLGTYNTIGFFLGLPILTIGGTGIDYGDRLIGVVFGLVFITSSVVVIVRF
ncbi:hypothetical protein [Marinobacter confluentis]|uniref:Uncharacterized protein n=1 Tax=Marinobacter confluentis TaxID=1697557 RepID=A0A4Z1BU48_9GAMM|nr:hypothetical protein [Marinobacter confluentis]TGN40979.1 hypothetical protein E5Q11_00010 [Marinobacter confluentis]